MPLSIHQDAANAFTAKATAIAAAALRVTASADPDQADFPIDPHVTVQITEEDIIGDIDQVQTDPEGHETARRFMAGSTLYELVGEAHRDFQSLCQSIHKQRGWPEAVEIGTVQKGVVAWLKRSLAGDDVPPCPAFVTNWIGSHVKRLTVLVPLHQVFVQEPFAFGRAHVRPITELEIDGWFARWTEQHPDLSSSYDISRAKWKKRIQGQAAVEVQVEAEPNRAYRIGIEVATDVAALLRILSPGSLSPTVRSYAAPLGRERLDSETGIVLDGSEVAKMTEGFVIRGSPFWKISSKLLSDMRSTGLDDLSGLLEDRNLTDYEEALLTALRIYSRCALEDQLTEKILHVVVAMETMLVKDSSEPIQDNVALRIAFLIGRTVEERRGIVQLVKEAYRKRSAFVHHGTQADDDGGMSEFLLRALQLFLTLAYHRRTYPTRAAMLEELETRKLS